MQKRPRFNIRAAAGVSFAGECRFYFWSGWLAWMLAIAGAAFGEYAWRVPDPPAPYMIEAIVMMTSWLSALFLADTCAVSTYRHTWQQLRERFMAPVVMEPQVVDQIRKELAVDPLLKWFKPPKSSGLRAQLLTAALWWQAVTAPEGTPRLKRYGEWFVDALLGYLPLALGVAALITWPVWRGVGTAALLGSIGMATLGYSALRFAARRQALLDYFSTWRADLREKPDS